MNNQTIDGVPREAFKWALEQLEEDGNKGCGYFDSLRALLDAPACKAVGQTQGEPVAFTAVGVLRDDGDGSLVPDWILEGGTSELWAGAVLLIADEDQELCAEDGHCELYRASK